MAVDSVIQISPFQIGARTAAHAVIRLKHQPRYLSLTAVELKAIEDLIAEPVTVNDFLARYLSGAESLQFQMAVRLLVKLQQNGFLAGISAETTEAFAKLSSAGAAVPLSARFLSALKGSLDIPLIKFQGTSIHPLLRRGGQTLVSLPSVIAYTLVLLMLALSSGLFILPDQNAYIDLLSTPESLLGKIFVSFSVAATWLAIMQMAALAGAGATFVSGSLRLTGLCVVRIAVDDEDALMLPKPAMARYFVFSILSPWVFGLLAYQSVHGGSLGSLGGTLCFAFAVIGLFSFCPLYKSPLVKLAEGFMASPNVGDRARSYLATKIFALRGDNGGLDSSDTEKWMEVWVTTLVCIAMLWLYGMTLLFSDLLIKAIPDLMMHASGIEMPLRAAAAMTLLAILCVSVAGPLLRLALVPVQNVFAVARAPLTKARSGIDAFRSKSLPASEAVVRFLSGIPILSHLSDEELRSLLTIMRFKAYKRGADIIRQGDEADRFFILADGTCQVVIVRDGVEDVVDVLQPGDSFGEIALIENVRRTATIRALADVKTLIVSKGAFDALFPNGSPARQGLTDMLRRVKLVVESEGLSHLSPRQIRELVANVDETEVAAGTTLIEQGTVGDACYLVSSGELTVFRDGDPVADLGRGSLVGAIALIKGVERTASVKAKSAAKLMRISKDSFLKVCMANVFVAMLIADQADKQIKETKDMNRDAI